MPPGNQCLSPCQYDFDPVEKKGQKNPLLKYLKKAGVPENWSETHCSPG